MKTDISPPTIIGEIYVDFTITSPGEENKLRLGGLAHAARGLWACSVPFKALAILPDYLIRPANDYFASLGCIDFRVVATVSGAPNVIAIFDATEVAEQGYEDLLRHEKQVTFNSPDIMVLPKSDVLIFPGKYDLIYLCSLLPDDVRLHIDVAYDIPSSEYLCDLARTIETIFISTSSDLFHSLYAGDIYSLLNSFASCAPKVLILKENRGGSRMISGDDRAVERLPAQLGVTVNSVGVGDVFAATFVAYLQSGSVEAAWRATYASAAYSQTTYPDTFRQYVRRDAQLPLGELKDLWGTVLPWEQRRKLQIYFAAPDFTGTKRAEMDAALRALDYHNFQVRRPIIENGELPPNSDMATLNKTYIADIDLLKQCDLVFAVPINRDPGTLVEVGIAIEANIPVVVYDPLRENANTMVIAGANHYSDSIDGCLNSVFLLLSEKRPE